MCLSWVRLTQHVSVLLNPLRRNTGAYYSNSSLFFYIASVGQFKSLLVTSYDVTFGCSWYLCPGNRKLHGPHALPCSEMHSLVAESVSGHAVCRDQVSSWSVNAWCWHKVFAVTLHVTIGEVLHGNLMSVSQITRKLRIRVFL